VALHDAPLLAGLLKKLDREDKAWDPETYRRKAQVILDQLLPMQRDMALDWHRRICLLTPGKNGKTFTVRARLVRRALLQRNANLLYIGLSLPAAKRDIWRGQSSIRHLCELLGLKVGTPEDAHDPSFEVVISAQDLTATFTKTGSIIRVGGADNMDAIEKWRGGEGYDEVWIDEAKSHSKELLETLVDDILEPRISWKDGTLGICGTPGSILEGDFYELTRHQSEKSTPYEDEDPDPLRYSCHRWSLEQNTVKLPGQTTTAWERALALKKSKGWTDQNGSWRREYLGQWCAELTDFVYKFRPYLEEEVDGKVQSKDWNIWRPKEKTPKNPFGLFEQVKVGEQWQPIAWQFGIGMDMGESDMFALEVFAFSSQLPGRLYQVHEVTKRFKEMDKPGAQPFSRVDFIGAALVEAIDRIKAYADYPMALVSDMAHMGETILTEVLIKYGHKVAKAKKQDKEGFISLVNDDLIDGRMCLLQGSVLATQMAELQYDETGKREMPGKPNDACDATLYARGELIRVMSHTAPPQIEQRTPEQQHVDSLLQKLNPRRSEHYTDFSTPYDPRR
jgi:hypothetical protein